MVFKKGEKQSAQARYQARKRKEWKAAGVCYRCGAPPLPGLTNCERCQKYKQKRWAEWSAKPESKQLRKEKHQRLKLEVFAAYGGAFCACCGDTHLEFLSVNHLNGDGSQHRKEMGWKDRLGGGGGNIYGYLKSRDFPPGFNILCMNCNFALGHSGYCPHQVTNGR